MTIREAQTYTQPMVKNTRMAATFLALTAAVGASTWLSAQALERAVYVTVLDRDGGRVTGLTTADFAIKEDNVTREVLRVEPASDPMQVAILVDNSQRTEGNIREFRASMPALVRGIAEDPQVKGRHQFSVITLGARPTIVSDYNPDPAVAVKALEGIFAENFSSAYLMDGIIEVSRGMSKRDYQRPVIVAVVTDGVDQSNRYRDQVLDPLKASGAVFHAILVGPQQNTSTERSIVLQRGTRETGGNYDTILAPSGLTSRMTRLAAELTSQYRVTYSRPSTLIPPKTTEVTSPRPNVTVRFTPVRVLGATEQR